ncbi:unnamed protein product [Caenorhabditis auriculariae]|uniref:Uncharacterized protein n=1 Tax=Caenorhabditis auriculariae TaxID=2777116 RepID=A0A8S1HU98_9PELO|nr:unnamed protein product [Caenorhabditis auriculariae]
MGSKNDDFAGIVIFIETEAGDYELRKNARVTWAAKSRFDRNQVRVEFFVVAKSSANLGFLLYEYKRFGDVTIAITDEKDVSYALGLLAMLDYKEKNYKRAKCLLRSDINNILLLRNYAAICRDTGLAVFAGYHSALDQNDLKKATSQMVDQTLLIGPEVVTQFYKSLRSGKFSKHTEWWSSSSSDDVSLINALAEEAYQDVEHFDENSESDFFRFLCSKGSTIGYSVRKRPKNPRKVLQDPFAHETRKCIKP